MSLYHDLRIRVSKDQKARIENLAQSEGKTLSEFVRSRILMDDLLTHKKLNQIINLLENKRS
jgi:uncharacterized protein (DUF1778 family)